MTEFWSLRFSVNVEAEDAVIDDLVRDLHQMTQGQWEWDWQYSGGDTAMFRFSTLGGAQVAAFSTRLIAGRRHMNCRIISELGCPNFVVQLS